MNNKVTLTPFIPNADSVQDLQGIGWQAGGTLGDGPFIEGGAIAGTNYVGIYGGGGVGAGTPGSGYFFTTWTTPYDTNPFDDTLLPQSPDNLYCRLNPSANGCQPECP